MLKTPPSVNRRDTRVPASLGNGPPEEIAGSALARFFELRGRRIVKGCGGLWYTVPGKFLMSLPYQVMLDPDPAEVRQLICDSGTLGARFPSLSWSGVESGLYVFRGRTYDIGSLHTKHRPRVRHAMERFEVRLATKNELLEQGRELNVSTMARQGRYDPEFGEHNQWARLVEAAFVCPEVAFPAAFCGSRLAAFMTICREQGWLHILHQMSRHDDLPDFPNHLLTYTVTREAAADTSLDCVCYGYKPLFAADGLHEYKLRFGYEMMPHRSAIQLRPILGAVLNQSAARAAVRLARRLRPANQQLETLETVLEGAHVSSALKS